MNMQATKAGTHKVCKEITMKISLNERNDLKERRMREEKGCRKKATYTVLSVGRKSQYLSQSTITSNT